MLFATPAGPQAPPQGPTPASLLGPPQHDADFKFFTCPKRSLGMPAFLVHYNSSLKT